MALAPRSKPHLTKAILEMKFMKKTKDRIEKELANTEGHEHLYSNIITQEMRLATGNYLSESSFLVCEDFIEGRLSFKGMNPEIERLMELDNLAKHPKDDMDKDISDNQLANQFKAFKRSRCTDVDLSPVVKKKNKTS